MASTAPAFTPPAVGPGPFPRAYWPWLALLLAVHVGIVAWAVVEAFGTPREGYRPHEFIRVTLYALAIFGTAFAVWGRHVRAIAWMGVMVVSAMLLTPAVTLAVGALLLNAYVVGRRVLERREPSSSALEAPHFAVATLTGISLWIGIIAIAAPMRIHFATVYAVALVLPLLVGWRTTADALRLAGRVLVQRGAAMSISERVWMALLLTIVVLHFFIVAKPETGYDAAAMHLQLPMLMAERHRWAFDVTRYIWADMPLGADWAFTVAYFVGGEAAARLFNFCCAGLACYLLHDLIRLYARRDIALASVCLFASTPLAFLETGTLYVENLWLAFLLGTLLMALHYLRTHGKEALIALAFLSAGALQCKVIGVIWLVPLLACIIWLAWRRGRLDFTPREIALLAVAVLLAAWTYANAWVRTGNPVFPFMNSLFRSPWYDTAASFNNSLYNAPLRPWSLYEVVWSSKRFIEGADGAAGFQWLLLVPVIALAFTRRRPLAQWLCLGLAILFFAVVFSQQSYLRYLLPAFALIAVLGGWALDEIPEGKRTRGALLLVGGLLCLINVRLMHTGSWSNVTLCANCAADNDERRAYVAQFMAERVVADYLNRNLPKARVGFYSIGAPYPAGFVGYSRAANWHDYPTFTALALAQSADDVLTHARKFGLTHIVYRDPPWEFENAAMKAFRERYAVPKWKENGIVIAELKLPSDR